MAKITAYGATELCRLRARFDGNDQMPDGTGAVSKFLIRSDGAILKKSEGSATWKMWKTFKPQHKPTTKVQAYNKLVRIVQALGYTVVDKHGKEISTW